MFDVKVCLVDVNERYIPNFGTQQAIKEKIYTVRFSWTTVVQQSLGQYHKND